jgi:predicted nucleotidyltransferase
MKTLREIQDFLRSHKREFQQKYGVNSLGVFGSYARGEAQEESDIDVLVEFEKGKKTFDNYMGLKFFLEDFFGKKVDLVMKETLREKIRSDILRDLVSIE